MDITQIFLFLKEFSKLKTKPIRDIGSFEKVLWFYDIPKEKECYSITQNLNSDNFSTFDTLIRIKKPNRKPFPDPPKEIKLWLKTSTVNKYTEQPQLHSYIISTSLEKYNERILLENHPRIKQIFENYLLKEWIPWSKEEKRLQPVLEIYNNLYKIYKKHKNQGETYQIVLGIGLLSCTNKNKFNINKHIITTPISIKFKSTTGTIEVEHCEQIAKLSLETDMLNDSEKPDSDPFNNKLAELSNDFWKDNNFDNCLKSWIHSYDHKGQFFKSNKPVSETSFPNITLSPAIILRKRNERAFTNFYNAVIEDTKNTNKTPPCLEALSTNINYSQNGVAQLPKKETKYPIDQKHYFPLPINEEQKNIIKKISNHNQVVVQGPPGTGKTHTIANLISHFLATGQKILVTSQTERALKVLKQKLPEEIQNLCVEILGKDQQALEELKNSCEIINAKYQIWQDKPNDTNIDKLEQEDNNLKGQIAEVENELINIKTFESKRYEKLFGVYTGSPAVIADCIKNKEPQYGWIKEHFDTNNECPIHNIEAEIFLKCIKNVGDIEDSVLQEPICFINDIFTPKIFEEKMNTERKMKQLIEEHKDYKEKKRINYYTELPDKELDQLQNEIKSISSTEENLSHRGEKWVKQALNDCLMDIDREWRNLYDITQKTLNENKDIFLEADKITKITMPPKMPHDNLSLNKLVNEFFEKYKPQDKIYWGAFCTQPIRNLKKIKIDEKNISSYEEVKKLEKYLKATQALKKINNFWDNRLVNTKKTQDQKFIKNYHIFKDSCEPLEECLSVHKCVETIKAILIPYKIPHFPWRIEAIREEMKIIQLVQAQKTLNKIKTDFEIKITRMEPYRNQQNQFAKKLIFACKKRNLKKYKDIYNQISGFKDKKKNLLNIKDINNKLKNDSLYLEIKKDINNPIWLNRLKSFEEAWVWNRTDQWLIQQTSDSYLKELVQKRNNLVKKQRNNMELLTSKKAWNFCLSKITNDELSSLKGWQQAISKIGKGTGKTAAKHYRVAQKRMDECKTAIPAWVMPLYRVVENIKPSAEPFDIAIIDEASQTGPDGFLLNYIAKKIIVVGDKEQISPENIGIKDDDVEILKKKYLSEIKFSEHIGREYSYYDYCETLFTGSHIQLREHFRCMPEIIQFSNSISYSGIPLAPLRQYGSSRLPPLKTTYVEGAISKIGNSREPQNEKEAKAIVAQIKKCITDEAEKYKGKTFGIIVLQGKAQIQIIEKALTEIDKAEIEKRAIHVGNSYDFQGDERAVIFLSMGIAKDWNMSALTKESYKRQYNVAASRAKDQMWLFHSVDLNDLSQLDFRRKLLSHCKHGTKPMTAWSHDELKKLYVAIKETKNKSPDNAPKPFDSWFEAKVFYEIAIKGYLVIPQYKVSGYNIDMIIVGNKGRLAIECDGDYWHSGEQKQQEDLERQWKLERCDWTFWRLPESIFNRNKEEALNSLWKKLDKMQIYPLSQSGWYKDAA